MRLTSLTMTITKGKTVKISYSLLVEGRLVKCIGPQKPLRYIHGKNQILSGLEKRLGGLKAGDQREFDLLPKEAYGAENPRSILEVARSRFPKSDHIIGKQILSKKGGKFLATVKAVNPQTLVLNFNHPLAGKKLHFSVIVVAVGTTSPSLKKEKRSMKLSIGSLNFQNKKGDGC